ADRLRQRLGQTPLLLVVERYRGTHLGDRVLARRGGPLDETVHDLGQLARPSRPDDERDELRSQSGRLRAEEVLDDGLALGRRQGLVREGLAQLVGGLEGAGEA